jgi:hypothetical protein
LAIAPAAFGDSEASTPEPSVTPTLLSSNPPWTELVDRYQTANRKQQDHLRDSTMEVEIHGKLPRYKQEAVQRAIRQVAPTGEVLYEPLSSSGDDRVIKEVIARYMTEEQDASRKLVAGDPKLHSIGITRENYNFKYKGTSKLNNRQVYMFQVTPKEKRLGLFKGEIWVDVDSFQTIREFGEFVRSPSIQVRKIKFDRRYEIQDDLAVPTLVSSRTETRLFGNAEIEVRYSGFTNVLSARSHSCPLGW